MAVNILRLNHKEAKKFFLRKESYLSIDIPPYFCFQDVLHKVDAILDGRVLNENEIKKAKLHESVNHVLYGNKDGKYAWRKFQIINPLLYVSLVNLITEKNNWKYLQERFQSFGVNEHISCESLPVLPVGRKKQRAEQITQWVNNIEKRSISLSLQYKCICHTDISDCYGSLYTHTVPWSIHTKDVAKGNRKFDALFGNKIDHHLQAMNNGQTNGIPQGSILMDFIAEIVLGNIDLELSESITNTSLKNSYFVLRHRDDYRIFVDDTAHGDLIIKTLSEVLAGFGLRLNTAKTSFNHDVVGGVLKDDKVYALSFGPVPHKLDRQELLRQLLIVQRIGIKFPNAGTLKSRLSKIMDAVKPIYFSKQEDVITGILIDIGYNNPNCFPLVAGMMSRYIPTLNKNKQKEILSVVNRKIGTLANNGLLETWIQRISVGLKLELNFHEALCKRVAGETNNTIFNSKWVTDQALKEVVHLGSCIDNKILSEITPRINSAEINIFDYE